MAHQVKLTTQPLRLGLWAWHVLSLVNLDLEISQQMWWHRDTLILKCLSSSMKTYKNSINKRSRLAALLTLMRWPTSFAGYPLLKQAIFQAQSFQWMADSGWDTNNYDKYTRLSEYRRDRNWLFARCRCCDRAAVGATWSRRCN